MARLSDGHNVRELEQALRDVSFPALKHDVILAARRNGAPSALVAMLESVPRTEFHSREDVIESYGEA